MFDNELRIIKTLRSDQSKCKICNIRIDSEFLKNIQTIYFREFWRIMLKLKAWWINSSVIFITFCLGNFILCNSVY